ncbi:LolA family protein [Natrarchaeobius chitinivorans]|uniref:Outer membrane lipoprotein carrier protein LolA n=1 Tax=Natrarchaeobius chitinivorans TaxID=1679083 RepID=A0A3N6P7P5_NATCH|nr:outer membrane lipoprotein carrier protein LolA [Natrarchaeobius chitinivorans]RQG91995.1 outer membrane lipoprotein carrier protein LolA [Natrarchaeobius chitinivorans]
MGRSHSVAVLCILAVVLLLGGCSVPGEPLGDGSTEDPDANLDHEPDPEAVFEAAFVHSDDLEDVSGVRTTTATDGTETAAEVIRVHERPYVDYRSEVLESPTATDGTIYVSNATTTWWYDAESNSASYYEADEPYGNEDVRAARAEQAERQLEMYDLEYRGTETIANRDAHVLEVEARDEVVEDGISLLVGETEFVYALETVDPADELAVHQQTIWIDAEYAYPLKEELVVERPDGDRHTLTERFDEVTFNAGVDDETFAFDPPEDAEVEDVS